MSGEEVDHGRRKFLATATGAVGAIGVCVAAVPFVASMLPSKQAEAAGAPVRVDVSMMTPGEQRTVEWRGKPIWIVRRTEAELATLTQDTTELRDPNSEVDQQPSYAKNTYRSIKPEYLVLVGICTHLGCIPTYRPEPKSISPDWRGGFYCSCHGSRFDLAGRVFKGVPAPINLEVPVYSFLDDHTIMIGENPQTTTA